MRQTNSLGRPFARLWAAYAVSAAGTWLAFGALRLIAVQVLHVGAPGVALLAAAGPAVGALVAGSLGPWVEFRRKRPVMLGMDLLRCAAMLSVPVAYALGLLSFWQLLLVSVGTAAANLVFTAASGAYLKGLVPEHDLLTANGRFETTLWTATALGPPLGGMLIGLFGPVTTVLLDALSYLLSALGIRAVGGEEPRPSTRAAGGRDIRESWHYLLNHPRLRPLFANTVLVNALIMAPEPLLAVLLLRDLGYSAWQYGLVFGLPCLGGLVGSRLARPLVARFGQGRVLRVSGTLRACWPLALALVGPGPAGFALVVGTEFALIVCIGVFNPVYATQRLRLLPADRVARTLSAWSTTSNIVTALATLCWGLLAAAVGARAAIALAGVLLLATPLLLRRSGDPVPESVDAL
ncbi:MULTISPECIES: MFS transporter [unclassified Nocardia]|uniref:MFS transporter n=1 Tax=unclassified Nocardia TaxID=2637762 RepID=UPI001CE48929|nr:MULTISPECIES: MFS transporter [unclassified Nocardia]